MLNDLVWGERQFARARVILCFLNHSANFCEGKTQLFSLENQLQTGARLLIVEAGDATADRLDETPFLIETQGP